MQRAAALALISLGLLFVSAGRAFAQANPGNTRTVSVISGRLLERGRSTFTFQAGWPGVNGQLTLAPLDRFNIGLRAAIYYGSPIMGFANGFGSAAEFPMRIEVSGEGDWHLSVAIEPSVLLAQGRLVGQRFGGLDKLSIAPSIFAGLLLGVRAGDIVTFTIGGLLGAGLLHAVDAGTTEGYTAALARAGLEFAITRDIVIHAVGELGFGGSSTMLFGVASIVRGWFGVTLAI